MSLWTPEQQSAIDDALNVRRNDPNFQGGMTDAQKSPATTSTGETPLTTTPTVPTTPTGGNAPTAQTAPTSSTVGTSGGSSSNYVPSQNLPGYNYTKPTWLDNMSTQDQMNYYKSDPNEAQLEINRAKQEYSDAIAKGDAAGAQRASAYADQIRQATGIANNDPFFGSAGGDLQSQGQANLSVNGQDPSSVNVYNGTSYEDAAHLAQTLGLSYSRDQNGKPVIGGKAIDSSYIDKNGNVQVPTRLVGNLLGMKVDWDPSKSAVTITNKKSDQLPQGGMGSTGNGTWMDAVAGTIPQTPQFQQYQDPNLSYYQNQMMPYSQFNPNMKNYYDQAKNQLDPQAQASYNQLMGKQNLDISHMNDSMNQRGIYTSGIAQAAENDLRAKTTGAIASIFTKEQSDIAKTAQSLYDSAYKQFLSGNQFALKNNTEMLTQMMAEKKQAFTQYIQSQHLTMDQANYALKAWDAMSGYIYKNAQMEMQDQHFNQTMDFNQFKFDNLSADQTANLHKSYDQMTQDWQKAMLPYQKMTQYQQGQLSQGQQKIDQQMFGMLGYVQGPDGTLHPTLSATKQQQDYALNLAKAMGYKQNPDGSLELTEQAKHDRATETSAQDANKMKLYDMMGFTPGPDGKGVPTLKRDQLDQVIEHDKATVQTAKDNATTSANKSVIDGIGKQLSVINSQISAMYNQGNTIDQNALKTLSDKRDDYLKQLSQYTNQGLFSNSGGFVGPPDPANFTPVSP